jgi:hypothetical protein
MGMDQPRRSMLPKQRALADRRRSLGRPELTEHRRSPTGPCVAPWPAGRPSGPLGTGPGWESLPASRRRPPHQTDIYSDKVSGSVSTGASMPSSQATPSWSGDLTGLPPAPGGLGREYPVARSGYHANYRHSPTSQSYDNQSWHHLRMVERGLTQRKSAARSNQHKRYRGG